MAVAKDPNGNECCLRVDANGSLLTFTGTRSAQEAQQVAQDQLLYGEMRMFGVDPGTPWMKADGQHVTARGKKQTLPDVKYYYVYLPDVSV